MALMEKLADKGIATQVHYIPVNHQPYYINRYGCFELKGADQYYKSASPYSLSIDEEYAVCHPCRASGN